MPVSALTNSTYAESLDYLRQHDGFGGPLPIPTGPGSLARFVRLAESLRLYQPGDFSDVDYAFGALSSVAQANTRWSIVFDIGNRQIHFMTKQTPKRRTVRLDAFDYSCTCFRSKLLDIDFDWEGDVTEDFQAYTDTANLDLLQRTYQVIDPSVSQAYLRLLAAFPATLRCQPDNVPRRRTVRR